MKREKDKIQGTKLKVWHISDTHGNHKQLKIPDGIDIVIHSGDASNWRDPYRNEPEMIDFLDWYGRIEIPIKIFTPGNHDSSIEQGLVPKSYFEHLGIEYLNMNGIEIANIKFWGSPFVPEYGKWSYMKKRSKINKVWQQIPEDTDVLITHGPPKYILDLTENRERMMEVVGDSALTKQIAKLNIKLHLFGHVHDYKEVKNAGIKKIVNLETIFSNGAAVKDAEFKKGIQNHGNLFLINTETKEVTIL